MTLARQYIGVNITGMNKEYMAPRIHVDCVKELDSWIDNVGAEAPAAVDSSGWPISTKFKVYFYQPSYSGVLGKQCTPLIDFPDVFGTYTCKFTGSATVTAIGSSAVLGHVQINNYNYDPLSNATTFQVIVTDDTVNIQFSELALQFNSAARNDGSGLSGIKDFSCLKPGYTTTSQLFTTEAINFYSKFGYIRYLAFTNEVNRQSALNDSSKGHYNTLADYPLNWSTRRPFNYARQNGAYGSEFAMPSIETIIALANATNTDIYLNVPINWQWWESASTNWLHQFIRLCLGTIGSTPLNSNLKVFLEYSNELFNLNYYHIAAAKKESGLYCVLVNNAVWGHDPAATITGNQLSVKTSVRLDAGMEIYNGATLIGTIVSLVSSTAGTIGNTNDVYTISATLGSPLTAAFEIIQPTNQGKNTAIRDYAVATNTTANVQLARNGFLQKAMADAITTVAGGAALNTRFNVCLMGVLTIGDFGYISKPIDFLTSTQGGSLNPANIIGVIGHQAYYWTETDFYDYYSYLTSLNNKLTDIISKMDIALANTSTPDRTPGYFINLYGFKYLLYEAARESKWANAPFHAVNPQSPTRDTTYPLTDTLKYVECGLIVKRHLLELLKRVDYVTQFTSMAVSDGYPLTSSYSIKTLQTASYAAAAATDIAVIKASGNSAVLAATAPPVFRILPQIYTTSAPKAPKTFPTVFQPSLSTTSPLVTGDVGVWLLDPFNSTFAVQWFRDNVSTPIAGATNQTAFHPFLRWITFTDTGQVGHTYILGVKSTNIFGDYWAYSDGTHSTTSSGYTGNYLVATSGTLDGADIADSVSYQWYLNNTSTPISGETSQYFQQSGAYIGQTIILGVKVTNSAGYTIGFSDGTSISVPVSGITGAPVKIGSPSITVVGTGVAGSTILTANDTLWSTASNVAVSGTPTRRWYRNNVDTGQTGITYTSLAGIDNNATITFDNTATNSAGSNTSTRSAGVTLTAPTPPSTGNTLPMSVAGILQLIKLLG